MLELSGGLNSLRNFELLKELSDIIYLNKNTCGTKICD